MFDLKSLLFDHQNNFQWASIAAAVALIAAVIQLFNNKKSIEANLKAKSRVEWIQNVRNLSAQYIKLAYEFKGLVRPFYEEKNHLIIDEHERIKIEEKWFEFLYTYNLILLYFEKEENNKIDKFNPISNNKIIDCVEKLKNEVKLLKNGSLTLDRDNVKFSQNHFYDNGIKPFRDNIRTYLKKEWDKAKNGK